MKEGARLVSEALLGVAVKVVVIADKRYTITSPTIHKLAGAAYHLSNYTLPAKDATIADLVATINNSRELAAALSWFIQDNEELTEELSHGTIGELANAIEAAYTMIDTRDFTKAVELSMCVADATAKPK